MKGTSNQESNVQCEQLLEKLEDRFGTLPEVLRDALQTTVEDLEDSGRLQKLLDLATEPETTTLTGFLSLALLGPRSRRGTPDGPRSRRGTPD